MGIELLSVLFVLMLLVGSPTHNVQKNPLDLSDLYPHGIIASVDSQPSSNIALNSRIIYTFITKNYKNVPSTDAKLITQCLIHHASEHSLDPKFTCALISRESGFNKNAISSTGAKGLGQIKEFNFKQLNIQNPYDIKENISGTTQYIRKMIHLWKKNMHPIALALASYYKGYGAVSRDNGYLDDSARKYIKDILSVYDTLLQSNELQGDRQ